MSTAILALMLAAGPTPDGDYERVKTEVEAKKAEGDYAGAIEQAAEAYARTADVKHLFAQAQAERLSGDCRAANTHYARVLADPTLPQDLMGPARDGFAACEAALKDAPPEPAAEPIPPPQPRSPPNAEPNAEPNAPPPPRDAAPNRRWYADPAGAVLLATGIAGIVVGGVLHGRSRAIERDAPGADSEAGYAGELDQARGLLVGAVVSYAIGGALLVGATVRYAVVGTRARRRVSVGPGAVRLRF